MSHSCHCQSGRRNLVLFVPRLQTEFADLIIFAESSDWHVEDRTQTVTIPVGCCEEGKGFASAVEVVNLLRTLFSESQLGAINAAWLVELDGNLEVPELSSRAKPLTSFAQTDSSPLIGILRGGRIETHFQPIFTGNSLELWGYECLMRGRDEAGNLVSPAKLIEWARQEELVFMLDRVCRETHLRNAGLARIPATANLLINFMPTAIYKPEYCLRTTLAAAQKAGIDPARIIFEVVESEEVVDRVHLANILSYYRRHGYRVALDDMGAGYAGLSLLGDLNPDLIKIDRDLISKATTSPIHKAICESLVRIGKDTGKLVLAEGVERVEEMELMQRAGADLFQGFLLGKPTAVPATAALLPMRRKAG